jgi:hypothetical protein
MLAAMSLASGQSSKHSLPVLDSEEVVHISLVPLDETVSTSSEKKWLSPKTDCEARTPVDSCSLCRSNSKVLNYKLPKLENTRNRDKPNARSPNHTSGTSARIAASIGWGTFFSVTSSSGFDITRQ